MSNAPHILIVEDDTLVASVVLDALEDQYRTSQAETAAEALASLRGGGIDAMLLDCSLPGGINPALLPTADELGIPVILMSGDPSRIAQLAGPGRRSILKPFSLTTLLDLVESVLPRPAQQ